MGTKTTDPSAAQIPADARLAPLSDEEIKAEAAASFCRMTAEAGHFVTLTAELARREAFLSDGATSIETWMVERTGMAVPTARAYAQVGERLRVLPHLAGALSEGTLSFDKVRAVAALANARTDAMLAERAKELSVRQLVELARSASPPSPASDAEAHERRSLRLNETLRTITAQLPEVLFSEMRSALETRAAEVPNDGVTPYDQRLADAFVSLVRAGATPGRSPTVSPYTVVAHVPLEALRDDWTETAENAESTESTENTRAESALFGELERGGMISATVARELLCGARIIVALDDADGHTMYEGRAKRLASATQRREIWRRDRCCRFPGCTHVLFAIPHHIKWWDRDAGTTDLDNLALLCAFHHGLVHRSGWTMYGDANEELTFIGPSGRVMTSRPSPLWARVTTQGAP
jgi:hypothetical protein